MKFQNREQAGEKLAGEIISLKATEPVVLAIPRSGVPVGHAIARALSCPLDIIPLMKIPIPWAPEASYGAVAADGTSALNHPLLHRFELSEREIAIAVEAVAEQAKRREDLYRRGSPFPSLTAKTVVITDDGLASGYSMLAAVRFVRKREPLSVIVAVPVATEQAQGLLSSEPGIDGFIVLFKDTEQVFSLPSFYKEFGPLADEDVIRYLSSADNR